VKVNLRWRFSTLKSIRHDSGFAYIAQTNHPELSGHDRPSAATVLENEVPLPGPANELHENIRMRGEGRYSFWHDYVYFSSSDNTNPLTNGRSYEIRYPSGSLLPFLRSVCSSSISRASSGKSADARPVNLSIRDSSRKALQRDVEYAIQIAQNYVRLLPGGRRDFSGKDVLEIGPGINFGSTLFMAAMGARAMVTDRFLAPWDCEYHPKFYTLLRERIKANIPRPELAALDIILAHGEYAPEAIRCYSAPMETLEGISDHSADFVFSNAVLEHLLDPRASFRQLARISRPGALGFHQVDFRDHNDFSKPLEYLLLSDEEFELDFAARHAERGNRYRPAEYNGFFQASGFLVQKFTCSCLVDESYLSDFIPRLRLTRSKYRDLPVEALRPISGLFCIKKI
jgi:hypothetical protein